MEKKKNPIAEQSRQWIMSAMMELLQNRPFEEITVSELSEKAGLSRRTFYRNFETKTEVVLCYCEQICGEYLDCLDQNIEYSLHHIMEFYFTFWEQHIDFLKLLSDNELLCHLVEVSNRYWPEIYNRFECRLKGAGDKEELEYFLLFNMGGLWNILIKWLKNSENRKSPKELEMLIYRSQELFQACIPASGL